MKANRNYPNTSGWQDRHDAAIMASTDGHEAGMVKMLKGWQQYATAHHSRFGSAIGEDYVLGPQWQAIGEGLIGLLNGETGRLDCGTLDAFIRDTMEANGCQVTA